MRKSFTLIELLIVIGILAILVVTILVTLNPSEAQKKTRDTKRLKDMTTLQAIILEYINDGNPPFCTTICSSQSAGPVQSQPCSTNWIGVNLCNYSNTIPVDPLNGVQGTFLSSSGTIYNPVMTTDIGGYVLIMSGSDYKIRAFLESKSNAGNLPHDASGNLTSVWLTVTSGPAGDSL